VGFAEGDEAAGGVALEVNAVAGRGRRRGVSGSAEIGSGGAGLALAGLVDLLRVLGTTGLVRLAAFPTEIIATAIVDAECHLLGAKIVWHRLGIFGSVRGFSVRAGAGVREVGRIARVITTPRCSGLHVKADRRADGELPVAPGNPRSLRNIFRFDDGVHGHGRGLGGNGDRTEESEDE